MSEDIGTSSLIYYRLYMDDGYTEISKNTASGTTITEFFEFLTPGNPLPLCRRSRECCRGGSQEREDHIDGLGRRGAAVRCGGDLPVFLPHRLAMEEAFAHGCLGHERLQGLGR